MSDPSGWRSALASRVAGPQSWWQQRAPRDRQILLVLGVLVAALLVYGWLWQPAAQGIATLERDLPPLRAQRGEVLAMAQEGRRLREETRQNSVRVPAPAARRGLLQRSLENAGLRGVDIIEEGPHRLRLRAARVDYGVWAAWVAGPARELGARLGQVSIQSLTAGGPGAAASPAAGTGSSAPNTPAGAAAAPGQVRADVVLEWRES